MKKDSKIYIAGHSGMVGSAILRLLESEGYSNIIFKTSSELDLRNQRAVINFFNDEKPEFVFLAAAKVGGINANNIYRADFIYDNLMMECNIIKAAHDEKVKKLLFLGSSCIYPKMASQPMKEESLLTGLLEETNEPYAIAKIAGIKLCENYKSQYNDNFISAMPTNLYGPNDNYDLKNSHVLPALIRKFVEASNSGISSVELWGTGSPLREFLHVDDLASACLHLMLNYNDQLFVNVGSSEEISIKNLAEEIKSAVGFKGEIKWDREMPNGTPRKLMDNSKINQLGWKPRITLKKGVEQTVKDFMENYVKYTK